MQNSVLTDILERWSQSPELPLRKIQRERTDPFLQLLKTDEGRTALAKSMVEPIRRSLEIQALRKTGIFMPILASVIAPTAL